MGYGPETLRDEEGERGSAIKKNDRPGQCLTDVRGYYPP
jgi:hypothetical protein